MGKDFLWSEEHEPHAQRKVELLQKHGNDLRKLMGHEPRTKYVVMAVIIAHLTIAYYAQDLSWGWYFLVAYVVGGTLAHVLFLAIHEITHHLAFRSIWANDLFAMVTNFPIVVPYAMTFKQYHHEHHRYQGWDGIDVDIPIELEGILFDSRLGKLFFVVFQIFFYALRPSLVRDMKITPQLCLNWVLQLSFVAAYNHYCGFGAIMYLLVSDFMAATLTPLAGHFISEHYVFDEQGKQETYSYYGPLNKLTWNVGYHNEHHDFPNVPWSRIASITKIAPDYYSCYKETKSWPMTLINFILDDKMSPFRRMKRERGAGTRAVLLPTTKPQKS